MPGPTNMVAAGFFYTGEKDTVKCFSCKGTISDWKSGMLPDKEHQRRFPNCKLVNNREERNNPMFNSRATNLVNNQVTTLLSAQEHAPNQMGMSIPAPMSEALINNMDFRTSKQQLSRTRAQGPSPPKNLGMLREDVRLATFDTWSYEDMVPASRLGAAGFYYIPHEDQVKCFHCGLCIDKRWLADFPASTHQAPSGQQCPFVQTLQVRHV